MRGKRLGDAAEYGDVPPCDDPRRCRVSAHTSCPLPEAPCSCSLLVGVKAVVFSLGHVSAPIKQSVPACFMCKSVRTGRCSTMLLCIVVLYERRAAIPWHGKLGLRACDSCEHSDYHSPDG